MTVDEIYLKIGQEIVNVIETDNWRNARLEFEIEGEGVVGYTGDYLENDETKDMSVENIDDDITDWLNELHEITTEGGNNKWNKSVFSLTPDGKYDMEFIWDQELQDEIERLSKR
ncbi:hypothetical protein [Pedobacter panaciterrae]